MSTVTAISYTPNFRFYPCLQPLKKPIYFQLSKPINFLPKNHIFIKPEKKITIWGHKKLGMNMIELPKIGRTDDVGSIMEGEEAMLIDGSSEHVSAITGIESLMNKLSKWLVASIFAVAILWKHDAEVLWASMGCVLNSYLSIVLKKIINQERPSTFGSGPGMPSSHAQSIFFAVVYCILSMVKYWGLNEYTITVGLLAFAFGSYLSWLRVSLRHHTISQISVGAVIGTIMSILWFQAWYGFVLNAFIANLWVRIVVVLGSIAVCVGFGLYVIQHWLKEEQ